LFKKARQTINIQIFKTKLHQLLRNYVQELYKEVMNPVERAAIQFLRRNLRRIAYSISEDLYSSETKRISGQSKKVEDVEQYLQQISDIRAVPEEIDQNSDDEYEENEPLLSSAERVEFEENEPLLSNAERLQYCLINNRAFDNFKAQIKILIESVEASQLALIRVLSDQKDLEHTHGKQDHLTNTVLRPAEVIDQGTIINEKYSLIERSAEKRETSVLQTEVFSLPGTFPALDASPQNEKQVGETHREGYDAILSLPVINLQTIFQYGYRRIFKSLRPALAAGFRRIEWSCVRHNNSLHRVQANVDSGLW
jgi:hypothetical protein